MNATAAILNRRGRSVRPVPPPAALQPEGRDSAKAAGLRYVTDTRPGIRRKRAGHGFAYYGKDGELVRDPVTLKRIRSLAIPPAWTEVWICPFPNGHIQATGRDDRGRKQYRYHPRWHEVRDETKYDRMLQFCEALPRIRARVEEDLARPGIPREKVLATAVRLLETTFIRVGNEEYARQNDSYGLTTLRNEHVEVSGSRVQFQFRGKSGKEHLVEVKDRRVAHVIKRCQDLPGEDLFQYVGEDGELHAITSTDVNEYLGEITGQEFTAKDFRTWAGTLLAYQLLRACEPCDSVSQAKRTVTGVIKQVASRLGNTPTVCRKCYVHPAVMEAYLDPERRASLLEARDEGAIEVAAMHPAERAALAFLRSRVDPARASAAAKAA